MFKMPHLNISKTVKGNGFGEEMLEQAMRSANDIQP